MAERHAGGEGPLPPPPPGRPHLRAARGARGPGRGGGIRGVGGRVRGAALAPGPGPAAGGGLTLQALHGETHPPLRDRRPLRPHLRPWLPRRLAAPLQPLPGVRADRAAGGEEPGRGRHGGGVPAEASGGRPHRLHAQAPGGSREEPLQPAPAVEADLGRAHARAVRVEAQRGEAAGQRRGRRREPAPPPPPPRALRGRGLAKILHVTAPSSSR
mmetsp:Transcript_7641/g.21530  ORF Transcript_7641/g.21530 Transcript_7641/m.21530 type:complete len:214 (-) Transcript_7641:102-743(-)